MDLNLLAALDALLAEGSVVGAAARLGRTPSATSRALARLRAQTGDPILVRAGRGLVPTPRAVEIRDRVRAAMAEVDALLSPVADPDPSQFERVVTIRADDAVSTVLGPRLLDQLRREAPGVTIVFRSEGREDVQDLRDGTVDLDVGVQGELGPEVRTRHLVDDDRVVLVRRDPSRRRTRIGLRRYAEAEHIDVSRRGLRRGPIDAVLEQHGLVRHVRAVVANQLAAALLVAQSDAVSLVSSRLVGTLHGMLPVEALAPPVALESASIALAWHPRYDGDPVHRWLRRRLQEIASSIARDAPSAS